VKKIESLTEFMTTQSLQIPVWNFIINLLLTALLGYILSRLYIKFGRSLSNRNVFSKNFVLMGMTTMLIITIVKSSLALSLGLVGALSIVRFRTAVKEPEELSYLFLTISVGLGLGADQRLVTLLGFAIIVFVIYLSSLSHKIEEHQNLYLTVTSQGKEKIKIEQIIDALEEHCQAVDLKRFDESRELLEASFLVEYSSFDDLKDSNKAIQKLDQSVRITFLDNKGIL